MKKKGIFAMNTLTRIILIVIVLLVLFTLTYLLFGSVKEAINSFLGKF